MTDFVLNNNTYTLAFPPLHSLSISNSNKKPYENSQHINYHLSNHQPINSSSSNLIFFHSLAPPKYPSYLKLTNYSTLVTEQYHHLQKKKRSNSDIEYNKDLEEIDLRLPQYWNKNDKSRLIEVGLNGFDATYESSGTGNMEPACIRTNFPMRSQCGIFYFEITIVSNGQDGLYAIGFCTSNTKLNKLPGYETDSFGYHGYSGMVVDHKHLKGRNYGHTFSSGDIVGCGLDFSNHSAFFTKNGVAFGCAFESISSAAEYYPCIGLGSPREKMTANFGQEPFAFDVEHYIQTQQKKLTTRINSVHMQGMDELVLSYLTHQGYIETASSLKKNKAYVKQVAAAADPVKSGSSTSRIEIRRSVMSGKIDDAIEQTEHAYPNLLSAHPDLSFKLKTRKFLEIMMEDEEEDSVSSAASFDDPPPVSASGRRLSWAAIAAKPEERGRKRMLSFSGRRNSHTMEQGEKLDTLRKAIEYGQELQDEYQDSQKYMDPLMDMFGLLSFTDPKSSPLAHLLDAGLRDAVASELNNAIQAYEHHDEISNLESLYKQCVVSNKELSLSGHGESSLLSIPDLYLCK